MTSRRESVAPTGPLQQPDELCTLGDALLARADDCWRLCEERLAELGIEDVGTPEFRARRRASQLLGVQLFARWLHTGEQATLEERRWLGGLGEMAARTGVSIAHMTRGYLMFRDAAWELIKQEANRLGTPRALLDGVRRMNSLSCDSSVLWMTRDFDAALIAAEGRFRSVYESLACGVLVAGPDGIITDCNDAAAAMLASRSEDLIGSNIFDFGPNYFDEKGRPLERVATAEAVATGQPIRGRVVKHVLDDGRARWHQVDAMPSFGNDGRLLQVVSTFVDVTAVREAEELRLESEAKSRFLATMSHELRTPLNSILGFAQLLQAHSADRLDEKSKRYLENIETSGGHLLSLIGDILELSKVATDKVILRMEEVEVGPAVERVAAEFEPTLRGRPIELRLDLSPHLCAHVDPTRFRQVVVNLLANALKFTESGSVRISTRRRTARLELRVSDTGIGIPADQIERVFEEFTQVDDSATRVHGGIGLGLPLTRRLVEAMGGTFTLTSVLGRGTTAVVTLPLAAG